MRPGKLDITTLEDGHPTGRSGETYRRCANFLLYDNCNWLLQRESEGELCLSCSMNQVIPALDRAGNLKLWKRIEQAKRRLLYSLLSLGLPVTGTQALRFKFMEDHRRNPDVNEQFVVTGHMDNIITINIAEADDATRHRVREEMQERYRTVLGHLRHESAHFYFNLLTANPGKLAECRRLFGDERDDYQTALAIHYQSGPPTGWQEHFISAYASSHPAEDFAETFAHFLLITDTLETARSGDLLAERTGHDWIETWIGLAIRLNEVNHSLGEDDAYPFLLTQTVIQKLRFIDRLVRQQAEQKAV